MRFPEKKEETKEFEPCLDTLIWLYKEHSIEDIANIIEEGNYDAELCRVCWNNFVFEGQWNWYVDDGDMHIVYQNLANGSKSLDYATHGIDQKCCDVCYEELKKNTDTSKGSYLRHLFYEYGTWKEHGCEGDTETCVYCAEKFLESWLSEGEE